MYGVMRKPRANILLLTIVLVLVGLVGRAWIVGKPALAFKAEVAGAAGLGRGELTKSKNTSAVSVMTAVAAAGSSAVQVEQLPSDATGLVVAMCDLQLMAAGTDLSLDSDQWAALAAVVVRTQAVRHQYEAEIGGLQVIALGKYRVEIPMYARAGDALRQQFIAEMLSTLGEATANDVLAKMGGRLEASFAGFGVSVQTLDITGNPARDRTEVQIARTASYWSSEEGGDRPATRREIHFPATEDPTGDRWDALLATLGEVGGEKGPI